MTPMRIDGYAPLRSYGAIGDGHCFALVADDGSVDWMAVPSLDAPASLAALVDARAGGRFSLAPAQPSETTQEYLRDTNVLVTTFRTADGSVRLTDAFTSTDTRPGRPAELVRRVDGLSGRVPMAWKLAPRFDHGQRPPQITRLGGVPVARTRELTLAVHAFGVGDVELSAGAIGGAFDIAEGATALVAVHADDGRLIRVPSRDHVISDLDDTVAYWRRWCSSINYDGPWHDAVVRSALALKLLIDATTGAVAAAGTTSLPEVIGGDRNWDYRYAWLRDSSFAIDALLALDLDDEAHNCLDWIIDVMQRLGPRMQVVLSLDATLPEREVELSDLEGYRNSRPVRVGNRAGGQRQLGIYGDVGDSICRYVADGNVVGVEGSMALARVADFVCDVWRLDDAGIWELEEDRPYTISKIGCWVALDRAVRLAGKRLVDDTSVARWRGERDAIRRYIDEQCWSTERGSYTFYAGSDEVDAACLLVARTGFADGDRLAGTVEAIRQELGEGPFLYRYSGMRDKEGAFVTCSFWLVEALVHLGRHDEAAALMDDLVAKASPTGLYSEEIDPSTGDLLGNMPQALSHLALVNAATTLA